MNVELLRVIARLLSSDLTAGEHRNRMGAPLLTGAVVTILLCALSRNAVFTITVIAFFLLRLSMMEPDAVKRAMRTTLLAAAVSGIFMLPAVIMGSPGSFGTVVMKVFESVLVLSVLRELVSWKELTAAMGELHLPGPFVLTLDMTVRFLVLLGRFSNQILEAVTLRRVGNTDWKNAGTGGVLGNTFLKAMDLSEQTAEAMTCRCWDGQYAGHAGGCKEAAGKGDRKISEKGRCWLIILLGLAAETAWFVLTQSWAF